MQCLLDWVVQQAYPCTSLLVMVVLIPILQELDINHIIGIPIPGFITTIV